MNRKKKKSRTKNKKKGVKQEKKTEQKKTKKKNRTTVLPLQSVVVASTVHCSRAWCVVLPCCRSLLACAGAGCCRRWCVVLVLSSLVRANCVVVALEFSGCRWCSRWSSCYCLCLRCSSHFHLKIRLGLGQVSPTRLNLSVAKISKNKKDLPS